MASPNGVFPPTGQCIETRRPARAGRAGGVASCRMRPCWRRSRRGCSGGLHCLAMCGGLRGIGPVAGRGAAAPAPRDPGRPRGRACGAPRDLRDAGRAARRRRRRGARDAVSPLQRALYLRPTCLLLALAVGIVRGRTAPAALEAVGATCRTPQLAPVAGRVLRGQGLGASRWALGVLWGLTPCALVYGVLPLALLSGGAWQGAVIMLAFGLGTLPNLLAAGAIVARARRWLASPAARWFAGAIVATFALAGVWRALIRERHARREPVLLRVRRVGLHARACDNRGLRLPCPHDDPRSAHVSAARRRRRRARALHDLAVASLGAATGAVADADRRDASTPGSPRSSRRANGSALARVLASSPSPAIHRHLWRAVVARVERSRDGLGRRRCCSRSRW